MSPLDALLERPTIPLTPIPLALTHGDFNHHVVPHDADAASLEATRSNGQGQMGSRTITRNGQRDCINTRPVTNRIFALMMHTTRYAFKAQARLATDCKVAPSTICRLLTGFSSPSFALIDAVTKALEKQLKRPIDPRELVSVDGSFPTLSTCALCGCRGCLPDEAYDENEVLRPAYKDVKPGAWTLLSSQSVRRALDEERTFEERAFEEQKQEHAKAAAEPEKAEVR